MAGAGLLWEKSTVGWLPVAGLFWEESTVGWWLISQTNRVFITCSRHCFSFPSLWHWWRTHMTSWSCRTNFLTNQYFDVEISTLAANIPFNYCNRSVEPISFDANLVACSFDWWLVMICFERKIVMIGCWFVT
jgi:hypothetical protein